MSKPLKLRPLRESAHIRVAQYRRSQSPMGQSPPKPPAQAPERSGSCSTRWRTGTYYSNSGLLNPYYQRDRSRTNSLSSCTSSRDSMKQFHPNVELRDSAEVRSNYPVQSMINRSSVQYDPIFHTVKSICNPITSSRQKGLSELLDRSRLHVSTPTPQYAQAFQANPKIFCKNTGEFTRFNDSCIRSVGEPFARKA